jgi:DNA-binding FadR family transcriptional regulator
MAGAALIFEEFHHAIINGCGNATLVIVMGALESLWSLHKQAWATYAEEVGAEPTPNLRASVVAAHEEITDAIEAGDAARAHQLVVAHLVTVSPMVIDHQAPRIDMIGAEPRFTLAPGIRS